MPDQIFISYRRDDAAYVTGHINDILRKEFGDEAVFTDVDNIALGVDFRVVIDETVSQCQVFLAVIGSGWLAARDQEGNPRLHDPADFVRVEIESALKRNIPVIPLLVYGAKMPSPEDLPDTLQNLAYRNGTPIRPAPDFSADMARLISNLRRHFDAIRAARGEAPAITEKPEPAAAVTERKQSPQEDEQPGVHIHVGDDERARKQAEFASGQKKKRSRAIPLMLSAVVIGAVAGWYYVDRNPDAMQSVLSAVGMTPPPLEQMPDAGSDAATTPADDPASPGEAGVPAPGRARATAVGEVGDSPAIEAALGDPETGPAAGAPDMNVDAGESTTVAGLATGALTAAGGDAATNPAPGDDTGDLPVAIEAVVAETAAGATAGNDSDGDGEIVLTPGSQRQSDASSLISEGVRLAGVGDHEIAIQNFTEALPLDVEPAFVYKQRGASYQALGQYEAAIRDYGQSIELNQEDPTTFYNRGIAYMALQNYAAAIADFDAVIQFDPEFVDAYSRRADAHEAMGNTEAATRDRAVVSVFESKRNDRR